MPTRRLISVVAILILAPIQFALAQVDRARTSPISVQSAAPASAQTAASHSDADYVRRRNEWFLRGRIVPGKQSAELRRRAYQAKLQMRAQHAALATKHLKGPLSPSAPWSPLGPVALASDATGNGTQNYNQVSGRATAIAIDPADPSGNTLYIGGAQGGIWKSTNGANITASNVTWTPVADDQATLSIGALAIQPGNTNPSQTLILAATGEADGSSDSYFGLGILRSSDAGNTWTLIPSANSRALSFSGIGGTRMAFSTATGQTNTVVAAMATSSVGLVDGAVTSGTTRGLYTSQDAGQTWNYDALTDPGGNATDATSATSVVYNASAGLFFAAIRYHGFYSSPDGVNWTRLATQPGVSALTTAACPPQSTSNNYACPIYRGEITVVPGRNEMYAWYIYLSSSNSASGNPTDGGIWQSLDGGNTWNPISDTAIANCGDIDGCGVENGVYNLELLAVPNAAGTDLYAGAVNLFKCSINIQSGDCTASPFINLTHVYGCDPIAAPSHVHPAQHALAYTIPTSGGDSGSDLMYFANDGGIYRALNGYTGLTSGSCSGTNQFDDLNQNLGSMTQFISFSQHPSDPNTLLGGVQGNGSPATNQATTSSSWINVLGGDGGYNAIDPNTPLNFYASNPDVPPGGLGIQLCADGVNCLDSTFSFVVTSDTVGGDDGAFYFPYILDPQSVSSLLVGTCRLWRGSRTGGTYTVLSPNFDTLGSGTCSGSEVNLVNAIAAGGLTDPNGSLVVYATTSGLGPINGPQSSPVGGQVWVTANASSGPTSFTNVTNNGPQGSINPNQFPISNVAMDSSDTSGATAYVTVMGFTGGPGHVWQTTNFGASWIDFTANLPDSPANAVVVDSVNQQVYVGTDVGVFVSSTISANWTEVGPSPVSGQSGFLPNVAVTALGLFNSAGTELLRASTYGRGVWQFPVAATPNYTFAISNSPLIGFDGQPSTFNGTVNSVNGYASAVTLTCVAGATPPPATCNVTPATLTPGSNTPLTVTVSAATGNYSFGIQAIGSDPDQITQIVPVTFDVVGFELSTPSPSSVAVPRGTTSSPVSFQVTAAGSFNQSVTVSCNPGIANASCTLTPGTTVNPTSSNPVLMTATVAVPAATPPQSYTATIQASTGSAPANLSTAFTLNVTTNPTFTLTEPSPFPEVNIGSTGTSGPISISAQDGFTGTVTLSCPSMYGANSCSVSPTTVSSFPATVHLIINGTSFVPGSYSLSITGTSGSLTNSILVPFYVGDYSISGNQSVSTYPGGQGVANLTLTSLDQYKGRINLTCDAPSLSGAQCVTSPANPVSLASDGTANPIVTINVPNNALPGNYDVTIHTADTTGEPTHNFTVALTVTQSFNVISTTAIQTVEPGQTTGAYNLAIEPVGSSFTAPVTLSCTGLPSGANCSFSPSTPVTPGNSAVDLVMSISAPSNIFLQRSVRSRSALYATWLFAPGLVIVGLLGHRKRKRTIKRMAFLVALLSLGIALISCAGASNSGGGGGNGNCSSAPGSPATPASSSSALAGSGMVSTTLTWPATNTNPACTVTYSLFENGSSTPLATVPASDYGAQLVPGTYSFTVAAQNSAGDSAQSPALDLGIYAITITGTSGGLSNQVTVFLVVSSNPSS